MFSFINQIVTVFTFYRYMFPRHLLCRHFWTVQQRLEFALHDLRTNQLPHYHKILTYLEAHASSIRDVGRRKIFSSILVQVGFHLTYKYDIAEHLMVGFYSFQTECSCFNNKHP